MQSGVGTALYGFSKRNCLWGWLLSQLSLCVLYKRKRDPRLLPGSIMATTMQMLNSSVLGSYQPAWHRGNKLSLKKNSVYAFYKDCLIVFCVKCSIGILASWMQMYRLWFLSETVCPGNVEKKSQTFGGRICYNSFIKTCASGLCRNDVKPDFLSLCRKDVFLTARQHQGCVGGSEGQQVCTVKQKVTPCSRGAVVSSWWLCYRCLSNTKKYTARTLEA